VKKLDLLVAELEWLATLGVSRSQKIFHGLFEQ
jgi:hypothetical protein